MTHHILLFFCHFSKGIIVSSWLENRISSKVCLTTWSDKLSLTFTYNDMFGLTVSISYRTTSYDIFILLMFHKISNSLDSNTSHEMLDKWSRKSIECLKMQTCIFNKKRLWHKRTSSFEFSSCDFSVIERLDFW